MAAPDSPQFSINMNDLMPVLRAAAAGAAIAATAAMAAPGFDGVDWKHAAIAVGGAMAGAVLKAVGSFLTNSSKA